MKKILGLDPLVSEFPMVYGTIPKDNKEIALMRKSVLEVLTDVSADIEVPFEDARQERVSPAFEERIAGEKIGPLVRILSSSEKPVDAFVSVPYRNTYFFIDDGDLMPKRVFSLLMFVFALAETGEKGAAPLVTIPTRLGALRNGEARAMKLIDLIKDIGQRGMIRVRSVREP